VRAARPVPELVTRHGYSASRDEAMAYLWAPDGTVRFFFTQHGAVIEDPATGSAAANLGGYFIATERALPLDMTLRQGEAVQRPSRLTLRVDANRAIFVGGDVIELGSGTFEL
jgi:predicted PhzF superfamily epimerase YddE/YHI9